MAAVGRDEVATSRFFRLWPEIGAEVRPSPFRVNCLGHTADHDVLFALLTFSKRVFNRTGTSWWVS